MGRLLRIQDRILLLLADIGDVFEELHDPGGWFKNYYQTLYGWVPYRYKRSNYKATFKRMLKVGYVEKIIKNGEPYLRLTSSGDKKLVRDFPIVSLKKKKWNGVGTLVIFDIEEIKRGSRDQLRLWLLGLGAGGFYKNFFGNLTIAYLEAQIANRGWFQALKISADATYRFTSRLGANLKFELTRPIGPLPTGEYDIRLNFNWEF